MQASARNSPLIPLRVHNYPAFMLTRRRAPSLICLGHHFSLTVPASLPTALSSMDVPTRRSSRGAFLASFEGHYSNCCGSYCPIPFICVAFCTAVRYGPARYSTGRTSTCGGSHKENPPTTTTRQEHAPASIGPRSSLSNTAAACLLDPQYWAVAAHESRLNPTSLRACANPK